MKRPVVMLLAIAFAMGPADRAFAYHSMSCAQAMSLVTGHPNIEASSIVSLVVNQWQAMDRRTVAGGHSAIASEMLASPTAINALTAQCNANPGQPLGAAAAQIYREARTQFDGF